MPKDSITWEDFEKRMEGFDPVERRVVEERLRTNFSREAYEFLTEDEAVLFGAMLDRLIPQDPNDEKIDLVGFMDWAIPRPLGFGDRQEGLPDELTLFRDGFKATDQTSAAMFAGRKFVELGDGDKDQVLRAVQEGKAQGEVWERIPSAVFFKTLMSKAVAGYCAHPRTWMRIGFYGPAYPEGYVWVSRREVEARHAKKPGHLTF